MQYSHLNCKKKFIFLLEATLKLNKYFTAMIFIIKSEDFFKNFIYII